jgi:hypothetical protein
MQTGSDGLETAAPGPFAYPRLRRESASAPLHHLRNFVLCINSHPHCK